MVQAQDAKRRDERIVFMMSAAELAALDQWRHVKSISTRAEAIRELIASGINSAETVEQLRRRLSQMEPDAAARVSCGHPLVQSIQLQPSISIHFHGGAPLYFVPESAE